MATIRDVARRAGVSISTASAALNRSAPVSEAVLARVSEAARETGYVPHGGAQSLRSGRSRLIGLIVPNIANPHFSAIARIVENVCLSSGYLSVVYSTGQDGTRESRILRMMRQQRVAGLIIVPTRSDLAHGQRLGAEIQVPTVLLDMPVEGLGFDVVKLDNVRATRLATDHLLGLGHRRIAALTGLPGLRTSEDRLQGFLEAHAVAGLEVERGLLLRGDYEQAVARASLREALAWAAPPTAVVTFSNMMTLGALMAAREAGRRVPEDLSLVGIDDLDFADLLESPPTTVRVPVAEMADRSIRLLLEEVEGARAPSGRLETYAPWLVERASCLPPGRA